MAADSIQPEVITTEDGSHTLFVPDLNETYHSRHGAMRESQHVFIENGLAQFSRVEELRVLEIGFGTGLNAWLSFLYSEKEKMKLHYTTLETRPLSAFVYEKLNYADTERQADFLAIHNFPWEEENKMSPNFTLVKKEMALQKFTSSNLFDLIYYDAFGPPAQPEMWEARLLKHVVDMMSPDGIFVTYCAKGQVRRDLEIAGLRMERLKGPPGKREMLRGKKIN